MKALSKRRERRLQRLADKVDGVLEIDRRFFRRFPHRRNRVRLFSRAEIAQQEEIIGRALVVPDGCEMQVAVRQIVPGVRTRVMLYATAGAPDDLPEEIAASLFDAALRGTGAVIDDQGR